ncbi:MAG: CPBP family intramembrane metalloprotease [Oscillospiraceae bacterium]|nr:CPBP family intramembrane metalloprotease [Oscillospiraceae bacterium]
MSKHHCITVPLSRRETTAGILYLLLQMFLLPTLISWGFALMGNPFNEAEMNFLFFLMNFLVTLVIFHDYLSKNLRQAARHPILLLQSVILGLAAYYASSFLVSLVIILLDPGYANYNDEAITSMLHGNGFLILIGTSVLVPPFEECMFRGLVFRNLYGRNRHLGYAVSMLLFSLVHITGYIGLYTLPQLLMACLQYLPAGLCLAWSYARADTIFAPILIHAAVNFISFNMLR